jgi:Zn-dependent protease with chaperone function
MKTSYRAAVAFALLAGFPVLVLVSCAVLVLVEVIALRNFTRAPAFAIWWTCVAIPMIGVLLFGLFRVERPYLGRVPEVPLSPEDQPRLWALVRELADVAADSAPDELYLVPTAGAAVTADTRLLGLQVKRRRLYLGAPLLAALDEGQLRAVLTHELAHYGNHDTRFGGITHRGATSLRLTLKRLSEGSRYQRGAAGALVFYARLYSRVSGAVSRRQELAADELAGRLVGGGTTASALREVNAVERGWEVFLDEYALLGWRTRYLPEHLSDGFFAFLADEARQLELEEIRRSPREEHSPHDTHPPMAVRIAALEAMAPVPGGSSASRPSWEILDNARETLDTAMETVLTGKALSRGRLEWPALVELGSRTQAVDDSLAILANAHRVRGGNSTIGTVLDALDAGHRTELAELDEDDDYPESETESVRTQLSTVVGVALADAGVAHWELSWTGPAAFVVDEPYLDDLWPAIESAVSDEPDTAALRELLSSAGVPDGYRPVAGSPLQ